METPARSSLTETRATPAPDVANFDIDGPYFPFFLVAGIALFLFFQSPSSGNAGSKPTPGAPKKYRADSEEKRFQDKIRTAELAIRAIRLKKREIDNELRKTEMEGLTDDKSSPYDTEIKVEKLRMKLEEAEMAEDKKTGEMDELGRQFQKYLSDNP